MSLSVRDGRVLRLAAAARDGDFSPSGKQVVYSLANGGVLTVPVDALGAGGSPAMASRLGGRRTGA
jgi:hypothetical protein